MYVEYYIEFLRIEFIALYNLIWFFWLNRNDWETLFYMVYVLEKTDQWFSFCINVK